MKLDITIHWLLLLLWILVLLLYLADLMRGWKLRRARLWILMSSLMIAYFLWKLCAR